MNNSSTPFTFDRVVRMLLTAGALAVIFALLRFLSDVLVPFAAAVVLAYFLNPLVTQIERRMKNRRGLAVGFTLGGVLIVGFAAVLLMVLVSMHQIDRFERNLDRLRSDLDLTTVLLPIDDATDGTLGSADRRPDATAASQPAGAKSTLGLRELFTALDEYRRDAQRRPRAERLGGLFDAVSGTAVGTVLTRAAMYVRTTEFTNLMVKLLRRVAVGGVTVINLALELVIGATVLLVILLYLVFLLLDYPQYRRTWRTFLPPAYRDEFLSFLAEFETVLRRYFRGQFVIACCTGIMFAIGFWLIGLPMAVPFGLFVGALNMVPYLQTVALVPGAVLAILRSIEGESSLAGSLVLVVLVFGVVQLIQDGLITPRIMGKITGLSPVAILLGLFIWGKLLGFLGLVLAIPLTCLGIVYYRRWVLQHSEKETALAAEPE